MKLAKLQSNNNYMTRKEGNEKNKYWKKVVFLFFLGWMAIYLNRTSMTIALTDIQTEFNLSASKLGLINSIFFFAYTFVQIPSGVLGDKFGRKLILLPGFIIFAMGEFFTAYTYTFFSLLCARFVTGFGEGTYYSPQYAISSSIIPTKYRSLSSAIINSGTSIGMTIGLIGSSILCSKLGFNWRVTVYLTSAIIFIVSFLFWKILKDDSIKVKSNNKKSNINKESLKQLFKNYKFTAACIVNFASCFGFYLILSWLPYYLATERGFMGASNGLASSLVSFSSLPGALIFSRISDKLQDRKKVALYIIPLAAAALSSMIFIESNLGLIICLIIYGLVGKVTLDPIMIAFVADSTPSQTYSTTFGVYNFCGMLSSVIAPTLAGVITDCTGSMATVFYLSSLMLIVGFISLSFVKQSSR